MFLVPINCIGRIAVEGYGVKSRGGVMGGEAMAGKTVGGMGSPSFIKAFQGHFKMYILILEQNIVISIVKRLHHTSSKLKEYFGILGGNDGVVKPGLDGGNEVRSNGRVMRRYQVI